MADDDDGDDSGGRTPRRRTQPEGVPVLEVRVTAIELRLAEIFGVEGDGGIFRVMRKTLRDATERYDREVDTLKTEIESLKTFRTKIATTVALATAGGSIVVGLGVAVIEHFLK